jgi:hypothetical protein
MDDWSNTMRFDDAPNEESDASDGCDDGFDSEEVTAGRAMTYERPNDGKITGILTFDEWGTIWQARR